MKNLLLAAIALSATGALAQSVDPYRVGFAKPLEFETHTKLEARKVTLKVKDGTWSNVRDNTSTFDCDVKIKIEGRDLAIKNAKIGEHYYGSMNLACDNIKGQKFITNFNRVLFLGLRNCVQSETVFDKDYCTMDVIAMRKEKDLTLENGDLVSLSSKSKKYFLVHSASAQQVINENKLIPEGLQVNTIDAYQVFKLSLGKLAQDFFIEKPNANSNFVQGQNIYLKANNDVLILDQKTGIEIDNSYAQIMNKLASIPSGEAGVREFEKQLPTILRELSLTLRKLLTMITPVEFVRSELKIKSLEKEILIMANGFKPTLLNREDFKREYAALSDEYNRYSNYLASTVQFKPVPGTTPVITPINPTPVQPPSGTYTSLPIEYSFEGKNYLEGSNDFFDNFIKSSCLSKVALMIKTFTATARSNELTKTLTNSGFKKIAVRIEIHDTRSEVQSCHNIFAKIFVVANKAGQDISRPVHEDIRINPNDLLPGLNETSFYNQLLNIGF